MIIRLRALAKDATLAAFASAKPGRPTSAEAVELELLRSDNDRLSEALKELAVELTLHRGESRGQQQGDQRAVARVARRCEGGVHGRSVARTDVSLTRGRSSPHAPGAAGETWNGRVCPAGKSQPLTG